MESSLAREAERFLLTLELRNEIGLDGILGLELDEIADVGETLVNEKPLQISLRTAILAAMTSILCVAFALQQRVEENSGIALTGNEQKIQQVSLEVFQALQNLRDDVLLGVPISGTLDCRAARVLQRQDGRQVGVWRSAPYFVSDCTVFISSAYQGSDRYAVMVDGSTVNGSYRSINGRLGLTMAALNKERKSRVLQQYFERLSAALNLLTKDQMIALFQFSGAACEQVNLNDARGNPISSWAARPASVASCVIVRSGQRLILTVTGSASIDGQVYTRTF